MSPNLEICGMCEYSIRIQTIPDVSQNNASHISHKVRPPSCVSWFRYPHRYISHNPNDNQVISQPGPSHHKSVINPIKSTLLLVKLTCSYVSFHGAKRCQESSGDSGQGSWMNRTGTLPHEAGAFRGKMAGETIPFCCSMNVQYICMCVLRISWFYVVRSYVRSV
jgi:hypothetical protein